MYRCGLKSTKFLAQIYDMFIIHNLPCIPSLSLLGVPETAGEAAVVEGVEEETGGVGDTFLLLIPLPGLKGVFYSCRTVSVSRTQFKVWKSVLEIIHIHIQVHKENLHVIL